MKRQVAQFLKFISVGKYHTTLYTKQGTTYQSSVGGGILTIFLFLTIGSLIFSSLLHVLWQDHHNLTVTDQRISSYRRNYDGDLLENSTSCGSDDGCKVIKVRDIIDLYDDEMSFAIYTDDNCSDFTLRVYYVDFGPYNYPYYRNYLNHSFSNCAIYLADLNLT